MINRLIRPFLTVAWLLGAAAVVCAQPLKLPLEFRQGDTLFNFRAQRGVPISTNVNPAIGSDGRMSNFNESAGLPFPPGLFPTNNQFRGLISFGGIPGLTLSQWQVVSNNAGLRNGTNAFSGTVAQAMGLPVGTSNNVIGGPVAIILRRGQIGAPYYEDCQSRRAPRAIFS